MSRVEAGLATPPLIQYWHQADPPSYIDELFDSFREHNSDRPHLVFNEESAHVLLRDSLGVRQAESFSSLARPKMQADYFRLCAVYALGGMWCDADCKCEASVAPLLGPNTAELFKFANAGIEGVNNAFLIFSSPGHPLLGLALEVATMNIERQTPTFVAGPGLLSTLVTSYELGSFDALLAANPAECHEPSRRLLLERLRGIFETLDEEHLESVSTVIGEARLADAMSGVGLSSTVKLSGILTHHPWDLPYQKAETGDHRIVDSVFR